MPIDPISSASSALAPAASRVNAGAVPSSDFGESLRGLIGSVDESAGEANTAVARMLDGTGDVHEAMIAIQRADMMLQMTVQVRNKLVQAYQDVMRMPI